MTDHVHMVLSIPPKYNVSSVVGYLKGNSAIIIRRDMEGYRTDLKENNFGPRDILPVL